MTNTIGNRNVKKPTALGYDFLSLTQRHVSVLLRLLRVTQLATKRLKILHAHGYSQHHEQAITTNRTNRKQKNTNKNKTACLQRVDTR